LILQNYLEKDLKKFFLDKNNIVTIPDAAFKGDENHFQSLEDVYLDAQPNLETIPANFIKEVPKLLQVSLGGNKKLKTITSGSFDLTKSKLDASSHLTIFLNDNPLLKEDQLTEDQFKLSTTQHAIRLDLENCGITEFKPPFVALITAIAKEAAGIVYLGRNNITTCDCTKVKTLRNDATKKNIWGISPTLNCTGDVKFDACPP